jgi:hypothetical protein
MKLMKYSRHLEEVMPDGFHDQAISILSGGVTQDEKTY